jgi:hypothetical protein
MPNHPPVPVQEQVNPSIPSEKRCSNLKQKFGIETGTHKENTSGKTKKSSRGYQSHHPLQDAATDSLIERGEAIAVMLKDSRRGTEHGIITKRQNQRMKNKKTGAGAAPATTFGDLKAQSRADIVAGLEGKRAKEGGKPITKKEAKDLANCLVNEAEKAVKKKAKDDKKALNDKTKVQQPDGCFGAGTLVWLANGRAQTIETLGIGDAIETRLGARRVVRIDTCRHDSLVLTVEGSPITVSTAHRLCMADGTVRRVRECNVDDTVATAFGPRAIQAIGPVVEKQPVWALATNEGPRVIRTERVGEFIRREAHPCPS